MVYNCEVFHRNGVWTSFGKIHLDDHVYFLNESNLNNFKFKLTNLFFRWHCFKKITSLSYNQAQLLIENISFKVDMICFLALFLCPSPKTNSKQDFPNHVFDLTSAPDSLYICFIVFRLYISFSCRGLKKTARILWRMLKGYFLFEPIWPFYFSSNSMTFF